MPRFTGYPMPFRPRIPVIPRARVRNQRCSPTHTPIAAQQKIPPLQGRDKTRGTTLIAPPDGGPSH